MLFYIIIIIFAFFLHLLSARLVVVRRLSLSLPCIKLLFTVYSGASMGKMILLGFGVGFSFCLCTDKNIVASSVFKATIIKRIFWLKGIGFRAQTVASFKVMSQLISIKEHIYQFVLQCQLD